MGNFVKCFVFHSLEYDRKLRSAERIVKIMSSRNPSSQYPFPLHLILFHFQKRENVSFYIHVSVHRESNLITVQQDATYSVYYISVGSSTCFGC